MSHKQNSPANNDDGPTQLSETNFDQFIRTHKTCIVDFWADWCAPCKIISPIIEELAKQYKGKVAFGKLNVDENPTIVERYEIMSIPTLLVFQDGQPVHMVVGAMPKPQLLEELKPYLE